MLTAKQNYLITLSGEQPEWAPSLDGVVLYKPGVLTLMDDTAAWSAPFISPDIEIKRKSTVLHDAVGKSAHSCYK